MKFDDILQEVGEFGLYQKRLLFLLFITGSCSIMQNISPVFTIKTPKHRCMLPDYPNDTYEIQNDYHALLVDTHIPVRKGGYSKCTRYDFMESDDDVFPANRTEVKCNKWVYDKSVFTSTLVTQLDLVCGRKIYRSHSSMMIFAGKFVGAFLNSMGGDYFGRRRVYTFMMLALAGTSVGIVFISNLATLMVCRFLAGAFTTGSYLCTYVICMEMLGPGSRRFTSMVSKGASIFAMLSGDLFAYLLRDWQHFQAALASPVLFLLIGYFFVPESPRWLVSKGRYSEAQKVLEEVARLNGKTLPTDFHNEAMAAFVSADSDKPKTTVSPFSLFRVPRLLVRYSMLYGCWILTIMCLYGLMLNVSNMSGNIFINFGLLSAVDIISLILYAFCIERIGRRVFTMGAIGVGGLACLATIFPNVFGASSWIARCLSLAGRMFVSACISGLYTLSPELFPTVLRSFGLGSCSMMSRIGGLASPYVADLNTYVGGVWGPVLPQIVFGVAGLATAVMVFFMPETKGRHLPESIRDAALFGRNQPGADEEMKEQTIIIPPPAPKDEPLLDPQENKN